MLQCHGYTWSKHNDSFLPPNYIRLVPTALLYSACTAWPAAAQVHIMITEHVCMYVYKSRAWLTHTEYRCVYIRIYTCTCEFYIIYIHIFTMYYTLYSTAYRILAASSIVVTCTWIYTHCIGSHAGHWAVRYNRISQSHWTNSMAMRAEGNCGCSPLSAHGKATAAAELGVIVCM